MPKRGYHHGNLKQALVDAALDLITEKGPTGFTLSEAAKKAGVTPAVLAASDRVNPVGPLSVISTSAASTSAWRRLPW